jgi:hypothetical protein
MSNRPNAALVARNELMASMYRQGLTCECIAQEHGISRQRAHQILKRMGIDPRDGGQKKRVAMSKSIKASRRDARYMTTYGVDREEYERLRAIGAVKAFKEHKKNSILRGIAFSFILADWWAVWRDSGKFEQRGRSKNSYVMSRIKDSGGYEVGNVCIKTLAENSREAVKQWRGRIKSLPCGVFENMPGSRTPFYAKCGRKSLGYHATPEEAVAARDKYMAEHNIGPRGLGSGRGWTLIKRNKSKPFLCQVQGMNSVSFATQEEAEAFYRQVTARLIAERQVA